MCVRVNSIQAIKWKFRAVKARFIEMVDGDAVFALQDSAEDTEKTLEHAVAEVLNVIIEKVRSFARSLCRLFVCCFAPCADDRAQMNVIMYPLLEAMLSEKSVDCAFVSASLARLLCFLNLELGVRARHHAASFGACFVLTPGVDSRSSSYSARTCTVHYLSGSCGVFGERSWEYVHHGANELERERERVRLGGRCDINEGG